MIRRPPRSTLFPTRRSSDLSKLIRVVATRKECALAARREDDRSIKWTSVLESKQSSDNTSETPLTRLDRKSTRLNSSHSQISYAVFCLKKKKIFKKWKLTID